MHLNWQDLTEEEQIKVVKLKKQIQEILPYRYTQLMLDRFPKYKKDPGVISRWVHYKYFSWDIYHDFEKLISETKEVNNEKN